MAHAGLGAQVHDALKLLAREQLGHAGLVGQIEFHEAEAALAIELRQARALQGDVIVVVEIVDTDDLIAARQQALRGEVADEARGTGDQQLHGRRQRH